MPASGGCVKMTVEPPPVVPLLEVEPVVAPVRVAVLVAEAAGDVEPPVDEVPLPVAELLALVLEALLEPLEAELVAPDVADPPPPAQAKQASAATAAQGVALPRASGIAHWEARGSRTLHVGFTASSIARMREPSERSEPSGAPHLARPRRDIEMAAPRVRCGLNRPAAIALVGLSGCSFFFHSRVGTATAIADTAAAVVLAGGAEGLGLATGHTLGGASLTPSTWINFGFAALVLGSAACVVSATEGYTHRRGSGGPTGKPAPTPMPALDPTGGPTEPAPP
jgi:hypothetical protein